MLSATIANKSRKNLSGLSLGQALQEIRVANYKNSMPHLFTSQGNIRKPSSDRSYLGNSSRMRLDNAITLKSWTARIPNPQNLSKLRPRTPTASEKYSLSGIMKGQSVLACRHIHSEMSTHAALLRECPQLLQFALLLLYGPVLL